MVAAGSSINGSGYRDIDMFMIPETFDHGRAMLRSPKLTKSLTDMGWHLQGTPDYPELETERWEGFNCLFSFDKYEPGRTLGKDETIHGKLLQMSLLLDKFDFEFPRRGREGDLYYQPTLNAEQLIELNRRRGARMVVLARSYVFGTDYSATLSDDLIIGADKILEVYRTVLERESEDTLDTLNRTVGRTLQEHRENGAMQGEKTPLDLRKKLRQDIYLLLESSGLTDRTFTNYADALINKAVKQEFGITK